MRDHKPYRRILAMAMSIIVTLGILPVAAAAEQPPIEASGEIISFAALPEKTVNQTVPLGTSLEELDLPVTVTATVYAAAALDTEAPEQDSGEPGRQESEQTDQSVPVTWTSAPDYDGNAAGVYTFTPQIEGFTLTNGVRPPQITVTAGTAAGEITAFAALSDDVRWQSVEYGTALEDLNLPKALSGTMEGGQTEVPVTWASEPSYDGQSKGLYLLTAVPGEGFAASAGLPVIAVVVRGEAPRFNIFARGGGALDTDPFLIDSAAQLAAIAGIVNEGKLKTLFLGAGGSGQVYLKLENDIDLSSYASADSGKGWTPIGNDTNRFNGSFDGDNHTITGLTINRTGATFQGLFGYLDSGSMVHNLGIVGVNIIGGDEASGGIGGVAGYANGTVQNCYVTGSISGKTKTGGIVGQLRSSGVVQSCYSAANITGTFYVGGVAGGIDGTVQNCYSTGSVSGTGYVGGVVGNGDAVQNCAALNPSVSLSSGTSIGRVVGSGSGFSGNIAFAGMKINGSTVSGGMGNDKSGADTTADTIGSDGSLGGLFASTDGWTTANGKLPGFGAVVDMPAHLLGTVPFEGAGSSINPYRIGTAAQLARLAELVNAGTAPYANAGVCYRLENSLDLSGYASGGGWVPIGREDPYPFKGEFNGGGNQITGLAINSPDVALQGLFGQTGSGSVVENLGVVEASIVGQDLVGGVAGSVSGTVRNCYVTGSVSGRNSVGGVAGSLSGAMQSCYTTAGVFGTQSGSGRAGGVVGIVHGSLTDCAALNPSVGGGYEAGRVAGDALTGSCSGNIAFAGMTVNGDTSNADSGAPKTADEIKSGTGLPLALKTAPWTYAPGKLPGLNGQTVDPPAHLLGDTPFVGSGETDAPFQISTAAQLARLAQLINEGNTTYNANGVCYQLMNSLDLSGYAIADSGKGWTPIGTNANRFKGSFDGGGNQIAGLAINRPSVNDQGLFGFIDAGGTVKNLGVTGISVVGSQFVGGVAGGAYGTVENCHSSGTISGYMIVGGVAGQVRGTVQGCYSSGSVTGSQGVAGGVAGAVESDGRVHNCYATGNVTGGGTVGGVAGHVNGMVEDCYATGRVISTSSETGGVTGYVDGTVENCAALNVSVAGGSASAGRIAGSTSNPTLSGNIAFAGMTVNGSVASGGAANNQNGADTSAGAIAADGTLGGLFTAANGWTVEDGKLPGFGTAVNLPLHLVSFSTTTLTVALSGTDISGSGTSYSAMTSPTDRTVTVTITGWADWTNKEVTVTAKKPDNSPLTVTPTDTVNGSATFTLPGGVEGTFSVTAAAKNNPVNVNKTVTLAVSTVTINSAAVNGVVAPAAGALPITLSSLTGGSNFAVTGLTWQNSDGSAAALTLGGKFKAGSAYKAVIELTAASGFKFPSGLTPGVDNGIAASGTVNGGDVGGNKLIFTVTFPATAAQAVMGVAVKTQPATLAYTSGEALDLAGLAATLTYNDGSTEDVAFAAFAGKGITASPDNGTPLSMATHNGHSVTLTCNTHTATTNALTVSAAPLGAASVAMTAPAAGAAPQTAAQADSATSHSGYTVSGLVWNEALTTAGKFKAGQVYTATITLTSKNEKAFQTTAFTPAVADASTVGMTTTNGTETGNTVLFTVTFPATAAKSVTGVAVKTQPVKTTYTAGEALNLAGLAATLTYNDGSTEDVVPTDFVSNGITVSPADGTALTTSNSNVTITHTASGKSAEQAITVHANSGGTGDSIDSGDGGGSGTTTPQYEAEVTVGGSSIKTAVMVDTKTGRAAAELSSQELKNGADSVVIMPKIPGVTDYDLGIPTLNLSSGSGDGSIKLNTGAGSVTLPSDMLTGTGAASGNTARISIGTVNPSGLTDSAQAAVGNRPVVSLSLYIDGKQTDWNNPAAPVTVSIPYTPANGENQNAIVIWYIDGNGNLNCVTNGRYDPETGAVTFQTTHFSLYAVGYNGLRFTDVASAAWYHNAVSYLAAREIASGTTATAFSPDATLTRGQFITLLLRAYGIEADKDAADNFSDAGGTYYTGYLAAAKRLGISNGMGDNRFAPEQAITRQEMFTLLYNALKALDKLPGSDFGKALSDFSDSSSIAAYAREAMTYLVKAGTVSGSGGKLDPTGGSTRAQMAQVLYSLLEK